MTTEEDNPGLAEQTGKDKIKILIIEDSPNINLLYMRGLPDAVFEKRFATNGQEGLSIYQEWRPEIIILDVMLPVLSGYTLLKTIRLQLKDNATAVIVSTSLSGKDDVTSLVRLGVQGYIVKPFVMKKIGGQILQYFEKVQPVKARKALAAYEAIIETLVISSVATNRPGKEENEDDHLMKWIPDFAAEDFSGPLTIENFCKALEEDQYDITLSTENHTLDRINELIQIPNLYEKMRGKKNLAGLSPELKKLLAEWQTYRNADYARMTVTARKKIRILNRLLLQAVYPDRLPAMRRA